ncbi:MAG: phosphoglucomutase (alpha-D-glucose-1,6-bisphosphate-dependent) [Victivallales bacterium]|nr:phosphoglucomutase (alpha-D-glucose-1,6-bisphosphate-dependent) [Victivallales bacterium]
MAQSNAGKPVTPEMLANIPLLISKYYTTPCAECTPVSFGTSGHRGSSLKNSFTEAHILAIVQAVCDVRRDLGVTGPLFLGMDTHALSTPAHETALEVLAANQIKTFIATAPGFTPTPTVSRSIIRYNTGREKDLADGIIITPSHNPPEDGGIKYNCTHGGPSEQQITSRIAELANQYMKDGNRNVRRVPVAQARNSDFVSEFDFLGEYVKDLQDIIDFEPIRRANLHLCADALGGAGLAYWPTIARVYGLDLTVRDNVPDPTFRFMCVDHDGRIRMDCSSPYAMAGLVELQKDFDLAFANDPDFDRHGIVCPGYGLMNPNHYLAVAIEYLFQSRQGWNDSVGIGKTLVSSLMIDRVAAKLGRKLVEVPVGFKWFVEGLTNGTLGFGGEESAGASFLKKDGTVWSTDKDGIILGLLAAEMTAVTGKSPAARYAELERDFGKASYRRNDTPATPAMKAKIAALNPDTIHLQDLAGDPIVSVLTKAPGNGAAIGGVKITAKNSWVAVRPSGTEDICKVYAESLLGDEHLNQVLAAGTALL